MVATAALITAAAARAMLSGVLVHQRHPKSATASWQVVLVLGDAKPPQVSAMIEIAAAPSATALSAVTSRTCPRSTLRRSRLQPSDRGT